MAAQRREHKAVVNDFLRLYQDRRRQTWMNTTWMGHRLWKCPLDLWIYQELIHRTRPELIIETGTAEGGSGFFLADMCERVGCGQVITVDVVPVNGPRHDRLTYLTGSSTDPAIVRYIESEADRYGHSAMVILDSDHTEAHVLGELRLYSPLVGVGQYLIVEDTAINGHPLMPNFGPGPMEAVETFLTETESFIVDQGCEKFLATFHPSGFLKRIA
jgi:cephalosporin hydroxylase